MDHDLEIEPNQGPYGFWATCRICNDPDTNEEGTITLGACSFWFRTRRECLNWFEDHTNGL